ncbi:GNAT family N-acetyltransferase [Clostridium cibarium]|uniref:GNAT family N-acetyltransferase n=1 Tax=Clostridium cibarium TaxID=2762247 RepID=A0ABR8PYD7_9CLOT|nr:GNAT family N-acetyltransferase [Clostridium cibarium]MBD7913182.1 GNAT family N-acetyltransferase [Clostridium cibarium]
MSIKRFNETISFKKYVSPKEYKEINELEAYCILTDKITLKLELDYKLNLYTNSEIDSDNINEFLYYINGNLVSYLGISCFGKNIGEINGMTHPNYRKKGFFKKLFSLAMNECNQRNFRKILLLTDAKSSSGIEFIKSVHGKYDFSEYRMNLPNIPSFEKKNLITLRLAKKSDKKEIARQNSLYWGLDEKTKESANEEISNQYTYLTILKDQIIGKISLEYNDNSVYIFGFGILPNFRSQGYGKETLKEVLNLLHEKDISYIELDVECKNSTALNLYKYCGFEEKTVMNYYSINT